MHSRPEEKEMDGVHEELKEIRAQKKQLEEECQAMTDLYKSLRKAHSEVLAKLQEAKLQTEKQSQELFNKSEEISELNKLFEDLKSSLHEKELFLRHRNSANEKLRVDYGERIQKLEGGNKELVLALDEAMTRIQELESKVSAANKETEGLKRQLSLIDNKSLQTKEKAQKSKELKQRDDLILKLEEEHRNFQDQVKWKNEQFQHLEEAHLRIQDHFRSSKAEWGKEKSAVVEEICSLQARLDSETRKSESIQAQLRMCNQALAHEESRRKFLEVEVSEYKLHFENVSTEFQEAKLQIEKLALKRDEEVAKLRNSLATKGTLFKEMKYNFAQLEQENQDLRGSLKEFQEAQISSTGTNASLKKLQKKIHGLEQLHKKCSVNFKEKEVEWNLQIEKVTADMNFYLSELKGKNEQIQELQGELTSGHCLLELYHAVFEMEWCKKESEETILFLTEQSELTNHALHKVNVDLNKKCDEAAVLMEKVESFDQIHMKQKQNFMEKVLARHEKMHAESSACQLFLKEQVQQLENALTQDGRDASGALEKVKLELSHKINEVDRAESDKWEYMAKNLKVHLEENLDDCWRRNENLIGIVKEKDERVNSLQQQIVLLESVLAEKTEAMEAFKMDKEYFLKVAEDKNSSINHLPDEIGSLRQESARRELERVNLAKSDAQKVYEHEKESLLQVIEEKEQMIKGLQEQAQSLKQDNANTVISFEEKQTEIDKQREAFQKANYLKTLEIEEKNKKLVELETEVTDLCERLQLKEESLFRSNQQAEQLEVLLQANKLETEKLMDHFGNERRNLEGIVEKLECQKRALLEDIMNLTSDREDLLIQMEGTCEHINEISAKDGELVEFLGKILQNPDGEKDIVNSFSPSRKLINGSAGMRSPLNGTETEQFAAEYYRIKLVPLKDFTS